MSTRKSQQENEDPGVWEAQRSRPVETFPQSSMCGGILWLGTDPESKPSVGFGLGCSKDTCVCAWETHTTFLSEELSGAGRMEACLRRPFSPHSTIFLCPWGCVFLRVLTQSGTAGFEYVTCSPGVTPLMYILRDVECQCSPIGFHGGCHHCVKQHLPHQLLVTWG